MESIKKLAKTIENTIVCCADCPLEKICDKNCEDMWIRFLTKGKVKGVAFKKGKSYLKQRNIVKTSYQPSAEYALRIAGYSESEIEEIRREWQELYNKLTTPKFPEK